MLKQEILFRGTEQECRQYAKDNGLQFGDDDQTYLRSIERHKGGKKQQTTNEYALYITS